MLHYRYAGKTVFCNAQVPFGCQKRRRHLLRGVEGTGHQEWEICCYQMHEGEEILSSHPGIQLSYQTDSPLLTGMRSQLLTESF